MIINYYQIQIFIIFVILQVNCLENTNENNNCILESTTNHKEEPVIGLILARGGSKGVYRKNLRKLDGISLLGRNIIKLKRSELFAEIWVSTEDHEISKEAQKYGALVHKRPIQLAADNISSLAVVEEFLYQHLYVNKFALFQCTSVFLKQWQIEEAFRLFRSVDCVFAVTRTFKLRWHYNNQNYVVPSNFDPKKRPRRQDWNGELIETGMFYFTSRQLIEHQGIFQSDQCQVVIIPEEDSLEIDNENDLKMAEILMKWR